MKWIKITEKFPPECENVLIWSKGFVPISAYLIYERNSPLCWHVNDWDESDTTWSWNEVSHWMPLPRLPQEENGVD